MFVIFTLLIFALENGQTIEHWKEEKNTNLKHWKNHVIKILFWWGLLKFYEFFSSRVVFEEKKILFLDKIEECHVPMIILVYGNTFWTLFWSLRHYPQKDPNMVLNVKSNVFLLEWRKCKLNAMFQWSFLYMNPMVYWCIE